MAKAKGLGKGLDAMLPKKIEKPKEKTEKKEEENVSRETLVKISSIEPNTMKALMRISLRALRPMR